MVNSEVSEKSKMGKRSRAKGQRFEAKVRQNLEELGWIVVKWTNTIDNEKNKVVPAKRKFNPFMKVMTIGSGFPDFICFKRKKEAVDNNMTEEDATIDEWLGNFNDNKKDGNYEVIGLEVKGNGYLDAVEKGMCIWYLQNKIFSRILIARRGKGREDNGIEYIDFGKKYEKKNNKK